MLIEEDGNKFWICIVHRAPTKSFAGTPLLIASPIPKEIEDNDDISICFEYYNEHPDYDPPVGSILEGWENEPWVFDYCRSCQKDFWRSLVVEYPQTCEICVAENYTPAPVVLHEGMTVIQGPLSKLGYPDNNLME